MLGDSAAELPITSYLGLLGQAQLSLRRGAYVDELRTYAVRCATAVESLLRLREWAPWLDEGHAEALSRKVRRGVIDRGLPIPFFKVTRAFMAAPVPVRKLVLESLYRPLLAHFGARVAGLLPVGAGVRHTFVQPANVIHLMSFLLYATVASAAPARLVLLRKRGADEVDDLALDDVVSHLADDRQELSGLRSIKEAVRWLARAAAQRARGRRELDELPAGCWRATVLNDVIDAGNGDEVIWQLATQFSLAEFNAFLARWLPDVQQRLSAPLALEDVARRLARGQRRQRR